jgi:hypothetical protein
VFVAEEGFLQCYRIHSVLAGCGSSSTLTSSEEQSALQGAWSGSGVGIGSEANGYTGTATLTVNGSMGALSIPSASCPVTFNIPLTMQPGKALAGSQFSANGVPYANGYSLSHLNGIFVSSNQLTLEVPFQTPCQSKAVDAQFTLTN